MMNTIKLSAEDIATIAALHGFKHDDPEVVESVEQALQYAKQESIYNEDGVVEFSAIRLLDCYLASIAYEMGGDSFYADRHEENYQ
jgi:hypothetical protein